MRVGFYAALKRCHVLSCAASSPSRLAMVKRRVRREVLVACMTCPLCRKLIEGATTISECLHTFCRKCIFEKLDNEEADCCPVCNKYLGCVPVEKLRADHNLQDICAKIFPSKRRRFNASELVPASTLSGRRKERSLSSLVVNPPRLAGRTGSTQRRTKARVSTLLGSDPIIDEPEEEFISVQDCAEKSIQSKRQHYANVELSDGAPDKNTENAYEPSKDTSELWEPLDCLVEAANRTKAVKSTLQSSDTGQINGVDNEVEMHKIKVREHQNKSKIHEENNGIIPVSQVKVRARRLQGRKKRDLETSAQAQIDAASAAPDRRNGPIWISLSPSVDQKGDVELSQTSACYLRIKDGNLPVSFIQKYLVKRHGFANESEVEIKCQGQTVSPTMALHNLADIWIRSKPPERVRVTLGTSAKDFIIMLNYVRKAPPSKLPSADSSAISEEEGGIFPSSFHCPTMASVEYSS